MKNIEEYKDGILLLIYVKPGSRETKLVLNDDIIFYTKEKPEKGKANRSLIKFLSHILEIPSNNIIVVKGIKNRLKTIYIKGLNKKIFLEKISHP